MKKYLAIMFTFFYFGFSSGTIYNVHYCLDQILISSVSSSDTCGMCGSEDEKDCCSSEVKILKTDAAQKVDITIVNDAPLTILPTQISFAEIFTPALQRNQFAILTNAPPDLATPALFITHCNFRI